MAAAALPFLYDIYTAALRASLKIAQTGVL
jgi:hypothetical protein